MADDPDNRKSRSRKLPPLANTGGADDNEGGENKPKPRPKKKKRPTTAKTPSEGQDLGESGPPAGPVEGSVRKKKRRPRPKPAPGEDEPPASGTGEDTVDGEKETTKPRKPRKKSPRRKREDPSGSQHSLIGQSEDGEGGETPRRTPRKKKKRTPRSSRTNLKDEYANGGLVADLADLEDDIIDGMKSETDADDEDDDDDVTKGSASAGAHLKSQPANKLFIEQKNRFRKEDKDKLAKRIAEEEERRLAAETEVPKGTTTLEFALSSQKGLRIFSLFIHGILGGFSVCQFSLVLLILLNYESVYFLDLYTEIAWPVQIAYYLMFVICTVSALDKYDICSMNRRYLVQCLTMQNGAISILFYFVAMILSLSIANTDDRIRLYSSNNISTLWGNSAAADADIFIWRNMNIARGCFAIVAWLIIALQPTYDRLSLNLRSGEENVLGEGKEMNSVSAV